MLLVNAVRNIEGHARASACGETEAGGNRSESCRGTRHDSEPHAFISDLSLKINKLYTSSHPHHQEAIEVEVWRGLCLGASWRYIAVGLYRGSYRSRSLEGTVPGKQLAVYSSRALQRKGGTGGRRKERTGEE